MNQSSFEEFYESILKLSKSFEDKDFPIQIRFDSENNIIRIYGGNLDSATKAKTGLEDVSELAYTTAEHHPFWNLLYQSSQISKLVLEKWNENLTKEELDEISWCVDKLKQSSEKLSERSDSC